MDIPLQPSGDDPNQEPQFFHIPDAIIRAENKFQIILPELLQKYEGMWVAVSYQGEVLVGTSQDEVDIAAQKEGFQRDAYVTRLIHEAAIEDFDLQEFLSEQFHIQYLDMALYAANYNLN